MELTKTVATNLKRVCVERDVSTRDLATRTGGNQKSAWNILNGAHSPRLSTLEPICHALMVSPAAVVTPSLDASLLTSRRIPRLIERYNRLSEANRVIVESIIEDMLKKD